MRDELWIHIDSDIEGDVLNEANAAVRHTLLENMDPAQVADATSGLDSDDVADILQELPDELADEILLSMDEQNRLRVSAVLTYPADTAGGLMNVDAVTVRGDVEVDVCAALPASPRRASGHHRSALCHRPREPVSRRFAAQQAL